MNIRRFNYYIQKQPKGNGIVVDACLAYLLDGWLQSRLIMVIPCDYNEDEHSKLFPILSKSNKYGVVPNRVSVGELASDFYGFSRNISLNFFEKT